MYEHNALGYRSSLALCLTKVRSSRACCPVTALILDCCWPSTVIVNRYSSSDFFLQEYCSFARFFPHFSAYKNSSGLNRRTDLYLKENEHIRK